MSCFLWRASAVRLAPIHNFNIVRKSPTAFLSVPLHTTHLSPITRTLIIGMRHKTSVADSYLGPNGQLTTELPKTTLIFGPPNSGKTALVQKVVNTTPNLEPVYIDLRGGTIDIVGNAIEPLKSQFNSYMGTVNTLEPESTLKPVSPMKENFVALLKANNSNLPAWSVLDGYNVPRPVLIVNEKIRFTNIAYARDVKAIKATVEMFLHWLMCTKKSLQFHVVLISSDPYFIDWLEERQLYFETMVVGDLTKSEAKRFFHEILTGPRFQSIKEELSDEFDCVFDMTGGRMLYINSYLDQYKAAKELGKNFEECCNL
ncbi:hypothetical protein BC937DRAFT_90272 [Endogone sp. FLAS-F59071]|nr:hypothetical protein BC937DRAFT_90272 [Endogone sp. FLAS-F59071]|eukprot:RUS17205.1 hypothetical protein BC937DRAFT_90272 [Endogone sp. FLAS-F59071]